MKTKKKTTMEEMSQVKEVREIMNVEEVAEYLGFTPRTIYKLIKEEGLPAARIGGEFRFKKEIVDSWIEGKTLQQGISDQKKDDEK